jgi:branched-chain amino acid transport system substrate-binding protein
LIISLSNVSVLYQNGGEEIVRKRIFIIALGCIVIASLILGMAACGSKTTTSSTTGATTSTSGTQTLKIGYLGPLTGPAAAWGTAQLRSTQLWADNINAAGGIKIGNETYKINIVSYDDQITPSKSLEGIQQLVLQDGIKSVFSFGNTQTTGPFALTNRVFLNTLLPAEMNATSSNVFCIGTAYPPKEFWQVVADFQANPTATKIAIVSQNDSLGVESNGWQAATAQSMGKQVVYNKTFPTDTSDFAPIMSAILATKPEIISFGSTNAGFVSLLFEQAKLQGFKGQISVDSFDTNAVIAKVGKEYVEGVICTDPDWNAPGLPAECLTLYNQYVAKYGVDAYISAPVQIFQDIGKIWAQGAQKAGSTDGLAISQALSSSQSLNYIYSGTFWWGKDVYGSNNYLCWDKYPMGVTKNGVITVASWVDAASFWNQNGAGLISAAKANGTIK